MKKLIVKTRERNWFEVERWITSSGLEATVNFCEWSPEVKKLALSLSLHDFYTGYVKVPDGFKPKEEEIEVHGGVTFSLGPRKTEGNDKGNWIGFDMAHYGDENMQNLEYAKAQCEKLAKQVKEQIAGSESLII